MNITDYISETPISRQELCTLTGMGDRQVRLAIQKAKETTPICNIGDGYFVPSSPNDPRLRQYVFQEMSRGKQIFRGIMACRVLMNEDTNQERLNV